MPYYLAPLWDSNVAAAAIEERSKNKAAKGVSVQEQNIDRIPKELRGKLKKARAAKGLLKDLEQQVRSFVQNWEEKSKAKRSEYPETDSEDEEIVFVGGNGQMSDLPPSPSSKRAEKPMMPKDQLVFDSLAEDHGANFGFV